MPRDSPSCRTAASHRGWSTSWPPRGSVASTRRTGSNLRRGAPRHPEPPLNYQIVYSLEGALDYYTTASWILRDGKRATVEALSELEPVPFPAPVGTSSFHTAGGLSTMAFPYEGKIARWSTRRSAIPATAIMKPIRDLGLLDIEPIDVKGDQVRPRDVFIAAVTPSSSSRTARTSWRSA